ncbi:MAG: phage capsid protein [Victivallaceae bacterium]|nr:phage capsid protein [Victivallaceae bacterium]
MPTVNIDQVDLDIFESNLRHSLQQSQSILLPTVTYGTVEGKRKRFNFIGHAEMIESKGKNADTQWQDIEFYNRWIGWRKFLFPYIIDRFEDVKKSITDPSGDIVRAALKAVNRRKDRVIIEAVKATAYTGENGETPVEFDAANHEIDVQFGHPAGSAANQPLNLAKIKELAALMEDNDVPQDDEKFIVCTQRDINALVDDDHLTSRDFTDARALQDGKIDNFYGFKFVLYNKLPKANNVRNCFAWAKSCMQLGVNTEILIDPPVPIPQKENNLGGMVTMALDATRLYDGGVFSLPCSC